MNTRISLERRLFATILLISIAVSGLCIWAIHYFVIRNTKLDYVAKYQTLSNVLGNTLLQLEQNTDVMMNNAAKVLQSRYRGRRMFTTDELKYLAAELNLTHIFVIDRNGKFVRSTNEAPELIPNLYSFCEQYRQLITGDSASFKTPIIPPQPELNPYKFVMVPTPDKKFIIEVGIKAEFISHTLSQALREDPNLTSLDLYSPDGTTLGSIASKSQIYRREVVDLSKVTFNTVRVAQGSMSYLTKISSSQPICCQCNKSGLSRSGEYYYVLKSNISLSALTASVRSITWFFIFLQLALVFVSFVAARFLSVRLVRNIHRLTEGVHDIIQNKDLKSRVPVIDDDSPELFNLSSSFNELLNTLEDYQKRLIEAEKGLIEGQIAKQVAHDIRSPLSALQVLAATVNGVPAEWKELLKGSCARIQKIADDLMARQNSRKSILVAAVIRDLVKEKQILFSNAKFNLKVPNSCYSYFCLVERDSFARIISNIIDNSVEASGEAAIVEIRVFREGINVGVEIHDNGPGFSPGVLAVLGSQKISTKGEGRGLGIVWALQKVKDWNGTISFRNHEGGGALILIEIPLEQEVSFSQAEPNNSIFL